MSASTPTLIAAIEAHCARHSISPVTFGRDAMNDPHFVRDLRNGRRVWPETEAKVRTFMASYAPDTRQVAA